MPNLKRIKAFLNQPVDVLCSFDLFAAKLLAKGDAALVRILPGKVTGVLMRVMRVLASSEVEWTPMGAKAFDPIVQIRGFRSARDLVYMDSRPSEPALGDAKPSASCPAMATRVRDTDDTKRGGMKDD